MLEETLKWLNLDYKTIHNTEDTNYMFCCPFHGEKRPSCGISESKLIGRCFSCGETFHLTKLIRHIKGFTYLQSIDYVSEKLNIQKEILIKSLRRYEDKLITEDKVKPITYLAQFNSGKTDNQYLINRGFDKKDIEEFKIGYDTNSHRVTIPIFNKFNKLMGVIGRGVHDQFPRYKVYDFSIRCALFPIHKLEVVESCIILVEGLLDAMWLHKLGIRNSLSIINANNITKEQIEILKSLDVSNLTLALDNDRAGKNAQEKIYNLLKKDFKIDVLDYGNIKDFQGQSLEIVDTILKTKQTYINKKLKRME